MKYRYVLAPGYQINVEAGTVYLETSRPVSSAAANADDAFAEALTDLASHKDAWRHALDLAHSAALKLADSTDDAFYWEHEIKAFKRTIAALLSSAPIPIQEAGIERDPKNQTPIDMILWCPQCGFKHVDEADGDWLNPPHRSHECQMCKTIWRPADVPTNGVLEIKTKGKNDKEGITWYNQGAASAIRWGTHFQDMMAYSVKYRKEAEARADRLEAELRASQEALTETLAIAAPYQNMRGGSGFGSRQFSITADVAVEMKNLCDAIEKSSAALKKCFGLS